MSPDFSRLLVCGDRHWSDDLAVFDVLTTLQPMVVIEGHARGADQAAHQWTLGEDVVCRCHPADWERHGKAAGPIRNRAMLEEEPTFVLAFHNAIETSRGTGDMLRAAHDAGIPYAVLTESDCNNFRLGGGET